MNFSDFFVRGPRISTVNEFEIGGLEQRQETEGLNATRGMSAGATFPFSSQGWIMEKFICGPHSEVSCVNSAYNASVALWTAAEKTNQRSKYGSAPERRR